MSPLVREPGVATDARVRWCHIFFIMAITSEDSCKGRRNASVWRIYEQLYLSLESSGIVQLLPIPDHTVISSQLITSCHFARSLALILPRTLASATSPSTTSPNLSLDRSIALIHSEDNPDVLLRGLCRKAHRRCRRHRPSLYCSSRPRRRVQPSVVSETNIG